MLRPFAVPQELRDYMQDQAVSDAQALRNLRTASGSVRGYLGWGLSADRVVDQRVRVVGGCRGVWLRTLHLRAVLSLQWDGGATLLEGTGYTWEEHGWLSLPYRAPAGVLVVSYDHGYTEEHEAIETAVGVCLAAAARLTDNPRAHRSESSGGESVTAAGGGADIVGALAAAERTQLAPWQLPVM